jgi:hypothetical protein
MMRALVIAVAAASIAACGPKAAGTGTTEYRAFTEHYALNITSDPSPPHAREKTVFKIRVRDKTSSQPIEGGEGIIYGSTYTANLQFVVATNWALALQFRKDSTQALEKVDTWYQTVLPERPATH